MSLRYVGYALLAILLTGCGSSQLEGDPETLLGQAWKQFQLGEYRSAVHLFEAVRDTVDQQEPDYIEAVFGLATTWNLRQPQPDQNKELAGELYTWIIENHPENDLAAWSELALARTKHLVPVGQDPDYEVVRDAYRHVYEKHPEHLAGQEAFMYLQSTRVMTLEEEDANAAVLDLNAFLKQHPDTHFKSLAYTLLSQAYRTMNRPQLQLDAEKKAFQYLEVDPTSPFQDNAWRYWQIATIAEFEAGDFETARKYYRLLMKEYPTDIRKYSATQALERMDRLEETIRRELQALEETS